MTFRLPSLARHALRAVGVALWHLSDEGPKPSSQQPASVRYISGFSVSLTADEVDAAWNALQAVPRGFGVPSPGDPAQSALVKLDAVRGESRA